MRGTRARRREWRIKNGGTGVEFWARGRGGNEAGGGGGGGQICGGREKRNVLK